MSNKFKFPPVDSKITPQISIISDQVSCFQNVLCPESPPQSPGWSLPNDQRRRSNVFPAFLRRKSRGFEEKDSIFASESTTSILPYQIQDQLPRIEFYEKQNSLRGIKRYSLDDLHEGIEKQESVVKENEKEEKTSRFKFGWVNGVYIRTVLNIWGVMLFLRMGWLTGQAGIVFSLLIILISTLTTIATAISMSAICTNGEVGTGGIYYMISRSLGPEAGSMIGIVFSLANVILVSANLVGAAETCAEIFNLNNFGLVELPSGMNDIRIVGAILLTVMAIIPLIGMDWEAKTMFVLLMILLTALADYFIGTFLPSSEEKIGKGAVGWKIWVIKSNLWPKWDGENFFSLFGIFFPSVIGIFAGASMSGDLKNPNEAIPKGTFLAIATTSSIYAVLVIFLGSTVAPYATGNSADMKSEQVLDCNALKCTHGLVKDYHIMTVSAIFGPLIYAGIFAATISSALGSYVCAPRIFQALCKDRLFPYITWFAKGYGSIDDPRRGYLLTYLIALAFIGIGDLNTIAPIISNFFMASFFLVNITCFHASFVNSPSFRPTFKYYNKWISLLAAITCIVIMFLLEWISAIVTIVIMASILLIINKKKPEVNWGSSMESQVFKDALSACLKLNNTAEHVKNFRPSILLLTGNPSSRVPLVDFANNITKNSSLLLVGHIIKLALPYKMRFKAIERQNEWLSKRNIKGFYVLTQANSLIEGTKNMMELTGLGKLKCNVLMLGYKSSWQECLENDLIDYFKVIHAGLDMHMGICILRIREGLDYSDFFSQSMDNQINQQYETNDAVPSVIIESDAEQNTCHKNNNGNVNNNANNTDGSSLPEDVSEVLNQFSRKQNKGTIDVWWIAEDGGLTLLIPYILSNNSLWKGNSLRIFSIAKNSDEEEIKSAQLNMSNLLQKFRIPFSEITIVADADQEPSEKSKIKFREIISKWLINEGEERNSLSITKQDLERSKGMTKRNLRLRELVEMNSSDATLIIMNLPLPRKGQCSASLYMSWLEIITFDLPPFLLIRGNQTSVLTFYS